MSRELRKVPVSVGYADTSRLRCESDWNGWDIKLTKGRRFRRSRAGLSLSPPRRGKVSLNSPDLNLNETKKAGLNSADF